MKNIILSSFIFFCFCKLSMAQNLQSEALFGKQYNSNLSEQSYTSLLSTHAASGQSGSDAIVIQAGYGNNQNLTVKGTGNRVLGSQIGNENILNLDLAGSNNHYLLEQQGSGNTLQMNKISSDGINFQVGQSQDGNSLTLEGSKIGQLQSMKIEQTGGMKVIIESNPMFIK